MPGGGGQGERGAAPCAAAGSHWWPDRAWCVPPQALSQRVSEVRIETRSLVGAGSPQVWSGGAGSQLRGRKVLGMLLIRVGASRFIEF